MKSYAVSFDGWGEWLDVEKLMCDVLIMYGGKSPEMKIKCILVCIIVKVRILVWHTHAPT